MRHPTPEAVEAARLRLSALLHMIGILDAIKPRIAEAEALLSADPPSPEDALEALALLADIQARLMLAASPNDPRYN